MLPARCCGARVADGLWNLPGGPMQPGEDPRDVAAREVLEEVGLKLEPTELRGLGTCFFN
nr:NUDIX domain-containing protein [Deinococcus piscis]